MEDTTKKKRIQVAFNASEEIRDAIKLQALERRISLSTWILRAVIAQLKKEREL